MAVRVDLKVRKNKDNKDFVKALDKFCKDYSEKNDCAIEFDDQEHKDVKFHWWETPVYKDEVSSGFVTHALKKLPPLDKEAYKKYESYYNTIARQVFSKQGALEGLIKVLGDENRESVGGYYISIPALYLLFVNKL